MNQHLMKLLHLKNIENERVDRGPSAGCEDGEVVSAPIIEDDNGKIDGGLIESMRNSGFKLEWEMGVYPTKQLLKDAIKEQSLFLAYLENDFVGAMTGTSMTGIYSVI